MTKYRIKTEEEFIEEFGERWKSKVGWNGSGMKHLFGIEINVPFNINIGGFIFCKMGKWFISKLMVKQIGIDYNHKKVLVYD